MLNERPIIGTRVTCRDRRTGKIKTAVVTGWCRPSSPIERPNAPFCRIQVRFDGLKTATTRRLKDLSLEYTLPPAGVPEMTETQILTMRAILDERAYQERKWPKHKHTPAEWILILRKLMHDVERAWVTGHGDTQSLHEVRQIAATAFACMEQCGIFFRGTPVTGRKYT